MKRYKAMIARLRYIQGAQDAELGKTPQSSSPRYLRGYSEQYAKEQIISSRTEHVYF